MDAIQNITFEFEGYTITTIKAQMQIAQIHKWLSEQSYWAANIPYDTVKTAIENSFCIGVLLNDEQVGLARLITDYAVYGYLADVYIVEAHRGKGLSKKMMETVFNLDWVKKLRGVKLATKDAHTLYEKVGFSSLKFPERMMEISRPDIYQ